MLCLNTLNVNAPTLIKLITWFAFYCHDKNKLFIPISLHVVYVQLLQQQKRNGFEPLPKTDVKFDTLAANRVHDIVSQIKDVKIPLLSNRCNY